MPERRRDFATLSLHRFNRELSHFDLDLKLVSGKHNFSSSRSSHHTMTAMPMLATPTAMLASTFSPGTKLAPFRTERPSASALPRRCRECVTRAAAVSPTRCCLSTDTNPHTCMPWSVLAHLRGRWGAGTELLMHSQAVVCGLQHNLLPHTAAIIAFVLVIQLEHMMQVCGRSRSEIKQGPELGLEIIIL